MAGGTVVSQLPHGFVNPIGGQSAIIKLRWGSNAEEMKIKEAKGYIKFALGENVKQSNWGDLKEQDFQTRMVWNKSFMMLLQSKRIQKKVGKI